MIKEKTTTKSQLAPQKVTYITPRGLAKLVDELDYLRSFRRKEVTQQLQETKGEGEETEFLNTLREQAFIEGRIRELERLLANYQVIEPGHSEGIIQLGSTVVIRIDGNDTETYSIVGTAEADPSTGFISNESPLGRALLESSVGDDLEIKVPVGVLKFRIVAVQ